MKSLLSLFCLICLLQESMAQSDSILSLPNQYPIDDNVTYEGGEKRILKILQKNLRYPPHLVNDSLHGTVFVYFTIDTNGHSKNLKVIKGIREDIDREAIRCVDLLDSWIVGRQNGRKIELHHIIPIKFSLLDYRKSTLVDEE